MHRYRLCIASFFTFYLLGFAAAEGQGIKPLITARVDSNQLTTLGGNIHALARAEYDRGAAPDGLAMERMLLVLKRSDSQQAGLDQLLEAQHNRNSPSYHKWLTPDQFGAQFGLGDTDLKTVTEWLQSQGFTVNNVSRGRTFIEFSGTAGQVQTAFHTEIHKFIANGETHWANATDPQLPAALMPAVVGIASLHNFLSRSDLIKGAEVSDPAFNSSAGVHNLGPADFATIYNTAPLYQAGITGAGTTIAVVARSNLVPSDITQFRSYFGLTANPPNYILNGPDPGVIEQGEATIDASWSGATAPGATVNFVISKTTNSTDGIRLSEEYIIDNNLGNVVTESYISCEAQSTAAAVAFTDRLAEQAAAEGITYMVSNGDAGSAGCDLSSATVATGPISTNQIASTPFTVAVGGTQFNENGNPAAYWNSTNATGTKQSVQSYIPENVWNQSCAAGQCTGNATPNIVAGGGGPSRFVRKPSWQVGVPGIPNDGFRDTPDVSLNSSFAHDGYALCLNGSCANNRFFVYGGTSVAAPAFAGIMALVNQATGSRQGQANYVLYSMAAAEAYAGCNGSNGVLANTCVFNDITAGNNAVPGEANYGTSAAQYQAGPGYDLASGLGSVNAYNLVTQWASFATPTIATASADFGSVQVNAYSSATSLTANVTGQTATPTFSLKYGSDFQLGSASCSTTSCSVPVTFVPTLPGLRQDALLVSYGASSARQMVSLLHGVGLGPQAAVTPGLISTIAGTGNSGYTGDGGLATAGALNGPGSVAVDAGGSLYIGDSLNNVIRRVDALTGVITTVAGNRAAGFSGDGGSATGASLNQPSGVAVDGAGNLYISDTLNSAIRKVDGQTGAISTVAGNGTNGFTGDGAAAVTATLNRPSGIAVDPSGNIFVADTFNSVIRRIDANTGLISTVAGRGLTSGFSGSGGLGTNARLGRPTALALDSNGNLYISDTLNNVVWKLDKSYNITIAAGTGTSAHTGDGGSATAAQLSVPSGLAIDAAGDLYIGENGTGNIREVLGGNGIITTIAGQAGLGNSGDGGSAATAQLSPYGMAIDSTGNLYIATYSYATVRKISAAGALQFGSVVSGSTSAVQTATLQNIGNQALTIGTLALNSNFNQLGSAKLSLASCASGSALAAGANCGFNLVFAPTFSGNYTGLATLSNAGLPQQTVALFGTGTGSSVFSSVTIDVPGAQSAAFQGTALFSGWAVNGNSPVQSILVSVDGASKGYATLGFPRSDVCQLFPFNGCPNVGWNFYLDTTTLASGSHTLGVTATLVNGQHVAAGTSFNTGNWTAANPFRITIDSPVANATITGPTPIGGWAIAGSTQITSVIVAVDGVTKGTATLGGARPDVCAAFPNQAGCPNVGWNFLLNPGNISNGSHMLQVTAIGFGGQASTVTTAFNYGGSTTQVNIDSPAQGSTVSGTAVFGGWAVDTNNLIRQVTVSIDGVFYGVAAYGGTRQDVCAVFPTGVNCPNVGWSIGVDTSQLANGTHTIQASAVTFRSAFFSFQVPSQITTFTVANSSSTNPIAIYIDRPTAGAFLSGLTTFSGWAFANNSTIKSVSVSIDSAVIGTAAYGSSRPDVCVVYPNEPGCPNLGWSFAFDTRLISTGAHMLAVTATTTAGAVSTVTTNFTAANWLTTSNPILISIDNPGSSTGPLSGIAHIGGWALDRMSAIASVSIAVDGIPYGNAGYGGARTDVCTVYPNQPGCPNVGWNAAIDTTYLTDGPHTLDVTATPTSGAPSFTTSTSFTVANAGGNAVRISLDYPRSDNGAVNGTVLVNGWATSDTAAIAMVQVLVDGMLYGTANYGTNRPDVCAVFPGRAGCPNVGWLYPLDTTLFANGGHMLEIVATGADGTRRTVGGSFTVSN